MQKYTVDCKNKFDELAKVILKLNMCRKELRNYDRQFKQVAAASSNNHTNQAGGGGSSEQAASTASTTRKNSTFLHGGTLLDQQQQQQLAVLNSRRMSPAANRCYGCAMSAVDHCITLFRVLLCAHTSSLAGYVRAEMCRQGVLAELISTSLKRSAHLLSPPSVTSQPPTASTSTSTSTATGTNTAAAGAASAAAQPQQQQQQQQQIALQHQQQQQQLQRLYERDIINIIFLLIKESADGAEIFQRLVIDRVETFLASDMVANGVLERSRLLTHAAGAQAPPLKYELLLLSVLVAKPDSDTFWEMRLRLLLHILLRSLNAAFVVNNNSNNNSNRQELATSNPIVIEHLTLPCLRMLNHVCKVSSNAAMLGQLIIGNASSSSGSSRQSSSAQFKTSISTAPSLLRQPFFSATARYHSEPGAPLSGGAGDSFTPSNLHASSSSIAAAPLGEIDANEFMQHDQRSTTFYNKWMQRKATANASADSSSSSSSNSSSSLWTKSKSDISGTRE